MSINNENSLISLPQIQQHFAQVLNCEVISNKIVLDGTLATGFFYADEIDEGCSFQITTIKNIKKTIANTMPPMSESAIMLTFTLLKNTSGLDVNIANTDFHFPYVILESTFITNLSHPTEAELKEDLDMRGVIILFNKNFLINQNLESSVIEKLFNFTNVPDKRLLLVPITFTAKADCLKLIYDAAQPKPNKLLIKNLIFKLLYEYIDNLQNNNFEYVENLGNKNFQLAYLIANKIAKTLADEKPLILAEIAAHFFISESKLKKVFKDVKGKGVYEYYQDLRLEKAIHLLASSNMTVSEIAQITGFNSSSKFSEFVKKATGQVPSAFKVEGL